MNKLPFSEHLLEQCLEEAMRAGNVEAVLRRHPQYADELAPLLAIALCSREQYATVPSPPSGLAAGRAWLLAAAAQERARARERALAPAPKPRGYRLVWAAKLASILLVIVVGVAIASGGVVRAANDSLPRDVLYPVKLSIEDVRLALAMTPAARIELALRFANERSAEIRSLAVVGLPASSETVDRMDDHVQYALAIALQAQEEENSCFLLELLVKQTEAEVAALEAVQEEVPVWSRHGVEQALEIYRYAYNSAVAALDEAGPFDRFLVIAWPAPGP
ncbi:MAG: hypothetical protein JW900_15175 [Anaerolineae bacterium]|nr:hypothetical protein [Anaerolineae bacterium]